MILKCGWDVREQVRREGMGKSIRRVRDSNTVGGVVCKILMLNYSGGGMVSLSHFPHLSCLTQDSQALQ